MGGADETRVVEVVGALLASMLGPLEGFALGGRGEGEKGGGKEGDGSCIVEEEGVL